MGVIQWRRLFKRALFQFNGDVIRQDEMFERPVEGTGLCFSGPDQRTYKWELTPHRWIKLTDSNSGVQLVRYHPKIHNPAHPAYLDISPEVPVSMLDHIILTFVYAEWKYKKLLVWGCMTQIAKCVSCVLIPLSAAGGVEKDAQDMISS